MIQKLECFLGFHKRVGEWVDFGACEPFAAIALVGASSMIYTHYANHRWYEYEYQCRCCGKRILGKYEMPTSEPTTERQ